MGKKDLIYIVINSSIFILVLILMGGGVSFVIPLQRKRCSDSSYLCWHKTIIRLSGYSVKNTESDVLNYSLIYLSKAFRLNGHYLIQAYVGHFFT